MSDRGTWLNESPVVSKDGPESTINETRNNTIFIIYKSTYNNHFNRQYLHSPIDLPK